MPVPAAGPSAVSVSTSTSPGVTLRATEAAAAELAQRGFSVTVLERRALPGGLNTYGVAEYKLRPPDSLREVAMIAELGVEFRFGVSVDDEDDLAALEKTYDAIFVGIGLGAMNELRIPGADHPDVVDALEFIARYKTKGDLKVGTHVVVVGAGNTAIDAANAARLRVVRGADEPAVQSTGPGSREGLHRPDVARGPSL